MDYCTSQAPDWLAHILSNSQTPLHASRHLLFHGTIEKFDGRLSASSWEHLRWTATDPAVSQSYCPETGGQTMWSAPSLWELNSRFLPQGDINRIIFRELGFDEFDLHAEKDQTGRFTSWKILPDHPTNEQALTYMQRLGYEAEPGGYAWVKTQKRGNCWHILPAAYKEPSRLFILEKPANLRVYDHASRADGGLTGRQWTQNDLFKFLADSGDWDGIKIDDIHHSPKIGHFSHESIGLFAPALTRLRYHIIPCVNVDPWDSWNLDNGATTAEFDALWESCKAEQALAA